MKLKTLLFVAGLAMMTAMTACTTTHPTNTAYRTTVVYHPYDYYYYPNVSVYFHITSGYYYYRDGTRWIRVRELPPRFYLDPRDRVQIRIASDKPYTLHHQHRVQYIKRPMYQFDMNRNMQERRANVRRYNNSRKRR